MLFHWLTVGGSNEITGYANVLFCISQSLKLEDVCLQEITPESNIKSETPKRIVIF